jgi:hypothetical protein
VRVIGRAVRSDNYREVIPGVRVIITGPEGSVTTATDQEGIYDVTGLPPGSYKVRADVYRERLQEYPSCRERGGLDLKPGDVSGCTLRID